MIIKYECIPLEFKRLGLTQKEVAKIFEISPAQIGYLIKHDSARIHWLTYALSNYYGK
jgi:plasmid maintenance system antidote protein VapI